MASHTPARLVRAGHRMIATEDGALICEVFSGAVGIEQANANEERLVNIWNNHDQIVAENVALREQLARKDDIFNAAINAALTLPDPVREQLVEALKVARKRVFDSRPPMTLSKNSTVQAYTDAMWTIDAALTAAGSAP